MEIKLNRLKLGYANLCPFVDDVVAMRCNQTSCYNIMR